MSASLECCELQHQAIRVVDRHVADVDLEESEERAVMEKKLVRKLDRRMCILVFIYILNYIVRNNVSVSRLRGIEEDLKLTGKDFDSILSIFYVGYILMQVPSNLFLNRFGRPSIYLPVCMMFWGIISIIMGFTTNFIGAFLTQLFLGFAQAAFFPGALFLLSKWYKRDELGLRTALFAGCTFSNSFGSLIAFGILDHMGGKLGHASWRWLFYITGSLTIFCATVAHFILPDFPATSKWLSPSERRLAKIRLEEDAGVIDIDEEESSSLAQVLFDVLRDWKVWWLSLTLTSMAASLSFSIFFPTLVMEMGFSGTFALLLCAPPWAFATMCSFLVARHSDAVGERFFHVVCPLIAGNVGFLVALSTTNKPARYVSLFLMAQSYSGFFTFYAWQSDSISRSSSRRAASLALINAFSQLGNIVGSYIWPVAWAPSYRNSYIVCVTCSVISIILCLVFRCYLIEENRKTELKDSPGRKGFRYML